MAVAGIGIDLSPRQDRHGARAIADEKLAKITDLDFG
jgi:hypothetical protein